MNYENPAEFSKLIDLVQLMLKERGEDDIYNLIRDADVKIVNIVDNTWFDGYIENTIEVKAAVKKYSSYNKFQIELFERLISDCLTEITKVDGSSKFIAKIVPSLITKEKGTIDEIVPPEHKELRQNLDTIRNIMVSVATGGERIQTVNDRYQTIHVDVKSMCKKMGIPYNNTFDSLWDWYGKWRVDFPSYQERRDFIRELFAPTLTGLDNYKNNEVDVLVQLDDWGKINRMIGKIRSNTRTAKDIEDFQSIGVMCREVLISLGQIVYNPALHGEEDEAGTKISKADAERMFLAYFKYKFGGKHNKELRDYVKGVKGIANQLTHKDTSTRKDMLLTVSTTLSLINFIGILEDKI